MRRSGSRNFTKAGLDESEGMSISGHETNSVYKRYNIIDEEMQRQALQRVQEQQQKEKETRKVVPLKRETVKKFFHKTCTKGHFSRVGET
jgi:hypothetical protein